jgi:hypothetical protein
MPKTPGEIRTGEKFQMKKLALAVLAVALMASMSLAKTKDHTVYQVENQDAVKEHVGHHVKVTATNNNGTLHVEKVDMLKDQGQKAEKAKSGM